MNDGQSAKQQIVESIKTNSNILVTVSTDPSVDELSAALGLTIMLNNLKKHATAVVSGVIPPAVTFLDPEKTFENTVDSLRDFIIALDKEKADHLRYKVDGDVVKIFITPYRTTISEEDLDFSQGDYNVELVLALGVQNKDHLDKALEAHGRILHDATVATISCGSNTSDLGSVDWSEPSASSISEMLVSLSESIKGDKPVLDEQTSTAFLTGIVAATDRFSNDKTSSKVMTMAAQLMAAGANQQLIAAKLEEAHEISNDSSSGDDDSENNDGTTDLSENTPSKVNKKASNKASAEPVTEGPKKADDGSLAISHEKEGDVDEVAGEVDKENKNQAADKAEDVLAKQLDSVAPAAAGATPSVEDLRKDIAAASAEVDEAATMTSADELPAPVAPKARSLPDMPMPDYEPTMGGTLNATTQQAADDNRNELAKDQNKKILNHGSAGMTNVNDDGPSFVSTPFSASTQPPQDSPQDDNSGFAASQLPPLPPLPDDATAPVLQTLADLDKSKRAPHEEALAAVQDAYNDAPFNPANQPLASSGSSQLGTVDHQAEPDALRTAPYITGLPPLPDFSTLPPPPPPPVFDQPQATTAAQPTSSPEQLGQILGDASPTPVSVEPNDPGQFKIPGQS